mgnify:CR=1 FL=1
MNLASFGQHILGISLITFFRHSTRPTATVKSILNEFILSYQRADARPLDIVDVNSACIGATTDLFVDRLSLLDSTNEEILNQELDPRIPVKVAFKGESKCSVFCQHCKQKQYLTHNTDLTRDTLWLVDHFFIGAG